MPHVEAGTPPHARAVAVAAMAIGSVSLRPHPLGEFFLALPLEMEGVGMIDTLSEEAS